MESIYDCFKLNNDMKIPWYNVSKCDEEKSRTQKNPRERGLRLRASYYRSV